MSVLDPVAGKFTISREIVEFRPGSTPHSLRRVVIGFEAVTVEIMGSIEPLILKLCYSAATNRTGRSSSLNGSLKGKVLSRSREMLPVTLSEQTSGGAACSPD